MDRLSETALAGALPIDIRMIKKVAAQFQRGIQQRLCLLLLYIVDSPTSYRNRRHQNTAFSKRNTFHHETLPSMNKI